MMSAEVNTLEKEFTFTDRDFYYISRLVGDRVGIDLPETKRELIYGRLAKRLRKLGLSSFSQYCVLLEEGNELEFTNFINAITTNVTSFFRENHHFDYLAKVLLPKLVKEKSGSSDHVLRIWSAGCSSGKEPYSIAMVLNECMPDISHWDVKILATDLDSNILDIGRTGIYPVDQIEGLSEKRCSRWLQGGRGANKGMVKINDELKELISFRQLNLIDNWPLSKLFDIIFCRNVTIYFDKIRRENIINRFANQLTTDGHLFVGHSESLFGMTHRFESVGRTIHKKVA